MKLKLYCFALREPDQTLGKLFGRHGRIDVLDYPSFRREQVEVGSVGDFHPMKILPAFLPASDCRPECIRRTLGSGGGPGLRGKGCRR
jgi:hypothetical protein